MIQTTVLVQSHSNFTCKLQIMRGGTLLILGYGSKVIIGILCIRPCGHDTDSFYAPGSNDRGHIVFVLSVCLIVCLSVCLFVCLLSTLTFAITFEP